MFDTTKPPSIGPFPAEAPPVCRCCLDPSDGTRLVHKKTGAKFDFCEKCVDEGLYNPYVFNVEKLIRRAHDLRGMGSSSIVFRHQMPIDSITVTINLKPSEESK